MADTTITEELAARGLVPEQIVTPDELAAALVPYAKTADLPSGGSGGGSAAPTFLRFATVRGTLADSVAQAGAVQEIMARSMDVARAALTRPRPVFAIGWYVNAAGLEVVMSGSYEIRASIEYPIGTFTQLLFAGSASGNFQGGDTAIADKPLADISIPEGALFAVKFWIRSPNGWVYDNNYAAIAGDTFNLGSVTPDLTMSAMAGGGAPGGVGVTHIGVLDDVSQPADLDIGDSNCAGDEKEERDMSGAFGVLARMTRHRYGGLNAGRSSSLANQFTAANRPRTIALGQYASRIKCNFGVNDCLAGAPAATTAAELVRIRNLFPDRKFYQATITPLQNGGGSTFVAQDGSDQVAHSNNGLASALNVLIRAGLVVNARPTIDGVLDVRNVVEHPGDPTRWRTYYTEDGIHPKGFVFRLIGATAPGRDLLFKA